MITDRIILGIDPGTTIMGYGIIQIKEKNVQMLSTGIIELKKLRDPYLKLKKIFERTVSLINEYHPDELAIESQFYGKNVQSMLKLGRAQGVAIAAALSRSVPIYEYAPRKIKMAITGKGSASKEQVAYFLKNLLKLKGLPDDLDATDGLAVAVCHYYQNNIPDPSKKYKDWKDFIKQNPDKIK